MINVHFEESYREPKAWPAYQYDYGQKLRVIGLALPELVEAHFSLDEKGRSTLRMGTCADNVAVIPVPDYCLESPGRFYCYIYDRNAVSGSTVYKIAVEVLKRADLPTETVDPSEEDVSYFEGVLEQMQGIVDSAKDGMTESFKVTVTSTYDQQEQNYTNHTSDKSLAEILQAVKSGQYVYAEHRLVLDADHAAVSYLPLIDSSEAYAGDWLIGYATFGDNGVAYYKSSGQWCPRNETVTIQSATTQSPERVEWTSESTVLATVGDLDNVTESYKVTVTYDLTGAQSTVTADKIFAEIKNAIDAGKFVFVAFEKIQDVGGEPTVTETQYMPLIYDWDGQYIRFGFMFHGNDGYTLYFVDFYNEEDAQTYGVNPVDYGFMTNQFAGKSAFDALTQRVNGMSASGVGEDCEGVQYEYIDAVSGQTETVTGAAGAERYNDYEYNKAIGLNSHAEGYSCEAWGSESHAEGYSTSAGDQTTFNECDGAHSEGWETIAKKTASHAEGRSTIAGSSEQHVQGKYNVEDNSDKYADIIGGGTGENARENIQTTDWTGVLWTATDIRCGGTGMDDLDALSLQALAQRVAALEQAIS